MWFTWVLGIKPRVPTLHFTEPFPTNYLCISQLFLSPYRVSSTTLSTRGSREDSRHRTQLNSLLGPSCSQSRQLFQNENGSFLFAFGFEKKFRLRRMGCPSVEKAHPKLAFLSPHRALLQYQLQTHTDKNLGAFSEEDLWPFAGVFQSGLVKRWTCRENLACLQVPTSWDTKERVPSSGTQRAPDRQGANSGVQSTGTLGAQEVYETHSWIFRNTGGSCYHLHVTCTRYPVYSWCTVQTQ